ncbi:hypothetical protein AB0A77_36385 [Streptomyces varsoviensis]|uniref:hypothetical protein n=1 Tax=Streptomyces varsoviensis TaxID=67373 RepID=UPI0033CE8A9E
MTATVDHGENIRSNKPRDLRWVALSAVIPTATLVPLVILCPALPFPGVNLNGQVYLDFVLPNHTGEMQALLIAAHAVSVFLFFLLLAAAYRRRSGDTATARSLMTGAMGCFLAMWAVVASIYLQIPLIGRGYPSFGSYPQDLKLITLCWNTANAILAFSAAPLVLAFGAVMFANRSCPLLPKFFGKWGALAVIVVNAGSLGCVFVYKGPWSVGAFFQFLVPMGFAYVWMLIVALALLRVQGAGVPTRWTWRGRVGVRGVTGSDQRRPGGGSRPGARG